MSMAELLLNAINVRIIAEMPYKHPGQVSSSPSSSSLTSTLNMNSHPQWDRKRTFLRLKPLTAKPSPWQQTHH